MRHKALCPPLPPTVDLTLARGAAALRPDLQSQSTVPVDSDDYSLQEYTQGRSCWGGVRYS